MPATSPELDLFVRDALARGQTRQALRAALAAAGWGEDQVRDALDAYAEVDFPVPVPRPRASVSAREAFQYLLLFATLYLSAWHLGSLLFDLISHWLPDPALPAGHGFRDSMRLSVAALVIAFPVFVLSARRIARDVARSPIHRLSPVRRWLTYLTLFLAAAVLIGDMTTLVYSVLGGEATPRFLAKVAVVAMIAGGIFHYYMQDLRREEGGPQGRGIGSVMLAIAGTLVLATIAAAVWVMDSPAVERDQRLDERRIAELSQVQVVIEDWARSRGQLPPSLSELAAQPGMALPVHDPVDGSAYGYAIIDARRYRLCAVFATDTATADGQPYPHAGNPAEWAHPAGRHCFERRLPALDPPPSKPAPPR